MMMHDRELQDSSRSLSLNQSSMSVPVHGRRQEGRCSAKMDAKYEEGNAHPRVGPLALVHSCSSPPIDFLFVTTKAST